MCKYFPNHEKLQKTNYSWGRWRILRNSIAEWGVKCSDLGARLRGFEPKLCYFLPMWPEERYLTLLWDGFFIGQNGDNNTNLRILWRLNELMHFEYHNSTCHTVSMQVLEVSRYPLLHPQRHIQNEFKYLVTVQKSLEGADICFPYRNLDKSLQCGK